MSLADPAGEVKTIGIIAVVVILLVAIGYLEFCKIEDEKQLAAKQDWYEKNARPFGLSTRMIGATNSVPNTDL